MDKTVEKATHGPQHDEFPATSTSQHGGATYDEMFGGFPAAHTNTHGKLFDKFSKRPGVDRYGEHWDEFAWTEMPSLHGTHFDEGYDAPSFDGGVHGQLHDVFRGARVRYMYDGMDVEGIVQDTHPDYAVVTSREGERHEVTLPQMLAYATEQGQGDGRKPVADPADPYGLGQASTSDVGGPQGERPSGESSAMGGGERVSGSYDNSVFSNKSFSDALEVVKSLVPFDEAVFDADAEALGAEVAKSAAAAGAPGVSHLTTKKLTEAHAKFSDHYAAARIAGSHDRAAFSAQVLAATHAELARRGIMSGGSPEPARPSGTVHAVQKTDVAKGYTTTPTHRVEYHPSHHMTAGAWPTKHAGKPTSDNLHKHVRGLEASTQTGGVNAHLGAMKVRGARVVDQRTGDHVAHFGEGWGSCGPHCLTTSKSVDSDETAIQSQDHDKSQGANWCKHCQHYCRRVENGHCPTCGGPVGTKTEKHWSDSLDVLKKNAADHDAEMNAPVSCPKCGSTNPSKVRPLHQGGFGQPYATGKFHCSSCKHTFKP